MAEQNPDLLKQAEELKIKVDGRWSDERIQSEIDKALGNDTAPKLIPVQVKRDFWDENGERHRKGTVVEVSVEAALDGVEVGALSRVR